VPGPGSTGASVDLRREATRASYQEVTLSQLDGLLRRVIVPERIAEVRDGILGVLSNVFDYADEPHAMVEEKVLKDINGMPLPNGSYLRVPRAKTSTYSDAATGTDIEVPGVILSVMRTIMRTDGVYCDAMLGQGEALDGYSLGLQTAAVEAKTVANDAQRALTERNRLGASLVENGNETGVKLFHDAFPPPAPTVNELELTTAPASNGTTPA
jgi:hypothetical protein